MQNKGVMLITGARKGIGRHLAEHYAKNGYQVLGCSRKVSDLEVPNYRHFCLDVADENAVKDMFGAIQKEYGRLDVLLNNAGIASMNLAMLTPMSMVEKIFRTNFMGTFLFSREAARLMQRNKFGRIVNFTTVAIPLKLPGETAYAASKAAINSLTEILSFEVGRYGITVNAIGPAPIRTDLLQALPEEKIAALLAKQAIPRMGEFRDVENLIDFLIKPESDYITGTVIYLGGV